MAWASELGLVGLCKPGYPGVLIVQGEAGAVAEYLSRLRALRWKAMAVRAQEEVEGGAADSAMAAFRAAVGVDEGEDAVRMLGDGAMGEAAAAMDALGEGDTFLRVILKITR